MGTIKDYKITDNDLFITEDLYWTFQPQRQDAIQVWHLTNVTQSDLDIEKLEELKNYYDAVDIEEAEQNGEKLLFKVYCDLEEKEYVFECDKIEAIQRPYNDNELTEIIIRFEKTWQDNTTTIHNLRQHIDKLKIYLTNQIEKKTKILEQISDTENSGHKKAKVQLDILKQIDNLVNNDSN
jgi:hypothetical protein